MSRLQTVYRLSNRMLKRFVQAANCVQIIKISAQAANSVQIIKYNA